LETSFFLDGGPEQVSLLSTFRGKHIGLIFECQQNWTDNLCQNVGRNPTYTTPLTPPPPPQQQQQQQKEKQQQQSQSLNYVVPKARSFPAMFFLFSDGECEMFSDFISE
jgi:hypothetical protein